MGKRKDKKKRKRYDSSSSSGSESKWKKGHVDLKQLQERLLRLERERDIIKRKSKSNFRSSSPSCSRRRSRSRARLSRFPSRSVERRERQPSILSGACGARSRSHSASDNTEVSRAGIRTTTIVNGTENRACSLESNINRSDACSVRTFTGNSDEEPLQIHNDVELPEEVLEILGKNPEKCSDSGFSLHDELVPRWRSNLLNGMPKDEAATLFSKHEIPLNLADLTPPKLNPEITTLIRKNNILKVRDASQIEVQNQLGRGISALGKGVTAILNHKEPISTDLKQNLLRDLCDAGRILTNLFHRISVSRRNCILPILNDNMKEWVDKAPPTEFLFGNDLTEKIKSVKNLESAGKELKTSFYQSSGQRKEGGSNQRIISPKNWHRPARRRGETGPQRGYASKNRWKTNQINYQAHSRRDKLRRKD